MKKDSKLKILKPATIQNLADLRSGKEIEICHKACKYYGKDKCDLEWDEYNDRVICLGCSNGWKKSFFESATENDIGIRFEISVTPSKIVSRLVEKTDGNIRYFTLIEEAVE